MASKNVIKKEEIIVDNRKVFCVGSEDIYDHPKIYLEIPENINNVDCPYCGRLFKYVGYGKKG